jgi:sugar phosphate permease
MVNQLVIGFSTYTLQMKLDDIVSNSDTWTIVLVAFSIMPLLEVSKTLSTDDVQRILLTAFGSGLVFGVGKLTFKLAANQSKTKRYFILGLTATSIITICIVLL